MLISFPFIVMIKVYFKMKLFIQNMLLKEKYQYIIWYHEGCGKNYDDLRLKVLVLASGWVLQLAGYDLYF